MEITVKLTIDPLGVKPDTVAQLIRHYFPEWITMDGYTILVTDAKVEHVRRDEHVLPSSR